MKYLRIERGERTEGRTQYIFFYTLEKMQICFSVFPLFFFSSPLEKIKTAHWGRKKRCLKNAEKQKSRDKRGERETEKQEAALKYNIFFLSFLSKKP